MTDKSPRGTRTIKYGVLTMWRTMIWFLVEVVLWQMWMRDEAGMAARREGVKWRRIRKAAQAVTAWADTRRSEVQC
jgi:hypothetical protein